MATFAMHSCPLYASQHRPKSDQSGLAAVPHANLDLAGFGASNQLAAHSPFATFLQGAPEAQGLDIKAVTCAGVKVVAS
ncbi:hypothetical protein DT23_18330 [Thioclava indica]|uniref:Uncharacterized protein n=1 Tax=Thioclava indica TaxID=1353528 RepID=A0A074JAH0_9RHOB|nr:hypothetical protein DT23_18330 [Thioclava indica]